jgi:hypothetical protein
MYARLNPEGTAVVEVGEPTRDPVFYDGNWYDARNEQGRADYIAAAGWVPVIETERPADTDTHTSDRDFNVMNGEVFEVWNIREWTPDELENREEIEEREQIYADIRAAYTQIEATGTAAQNDIVNAETRRQQSLGLASQIATQRGQVEAWVSQTTTTAARADLYALRDQLATVLQRQQAIVEAVAESYGYRKANDENVVVTSRALMWVARFIGGRV